MSCWVVPSVAAEFWQVSIDHVLDQLRRNALPVRRENGFTFIDILPDPAATTPLPPDQRPQTFMPAPPAALISADQPAANCDWISRNRLRVQTASLRRSPSAGGN